MSEAELTGRDWACGFMRGVAMRMDLWDSRLPQDEHLNTFLGHVLILSVSSGTAAEVGVTPEQRAKMLDNLPLAVLGMSKYWRENPIGRSAAAASPPLRREKVGRNEPCPCGSSKKFKRCCGAAGETLH